jgi:SAM-dependent methyltransferase
MNNDDPFFKAYDRDEIAYGFEPSAEVASFVAQTSPSGLAIDLGAGPGRNAIALASAGMRVRAVDMSRRGLTRLMERARLLGLDHLIEVQVADIRSVELPVNEVSVIVATTVLDHMLLVDAVDVWSRIERALTDDGVVFAEVHTTEDPGCREYPGSENPYPVSETACGVKHYYRAGELLKLAMKSGVLRVLRYEERQEWDYTHGSEHHHGKATLLAVRAGHYPPWYGHPLAFPRNA